MALERNRIQQTLDSFQSFKHTLDLTYRPHSLVMARLDLILALLWTLFFVPSHCIVPTVQTNLRARHEPRISFNDPNRALKRGLTPIKLLHERQDDSDKRSESVVIDNSWNDAVLLPV